MRVPLEWLKGYVAIRLSPEALAERLTMAGLEVIAIHEVDGKPVLDLELTPNRADCLSIIGIAREVAALTGQRLKPPQALGSRLKAKGKRQQRRPPASSLQPPAQLTIRIEDHTGCRRYIGRLIEGVRIGPSPEWMQRRLIACGQNPINNVVDITNYVLFERGQPLHAFDFSRLAQGTVLARRARAGEPVTTLDGVQRTLSPETLVIADARQPVAVAGVMGGVGSEVTPQTTRVLLESALFDPVTVRRAARKLGLASESSYRFERGVDPVGVESASAHAASLIVQLAGGKETALCDVGSKPPVRPAITLEPQRLGRWLGMRVDPSAIRTILARLSCRVASSGAASTLRVIPPSFRQDLVRDVDLHEELARVIGYDRVPATLPVSPIVAGGAEGSSTYWRTQSLKCLCASLGLTETISWSLVSEADLTRFGFTPAQAARLSNPLSQDHAYLRPSLAVGLLQSVRRNLTHGASGVRIFEVGHVVRPSAREESPWLGVALAGWWLRDWRRQEACDFWILKGLLQAVIGRLCDGTGQFVGSAAPWAEAGECAEVRLNGRAIGVAGRVSEAISQALDFRQGVWVAELSIEGMLTSRRPHPMVRMPAAFPSVKRDLSILVGTDVPFEAIGRVIREAAGTQASRVELIDRFVKGAQLPPGKHSLTFSIEYQDPARTLTATEADVLHQRIGQALADRFKATLR